MRIRLDISYDGSHFRGWARQPHQRTVQGTIEGAIARVLGGEPRLVVAGRTDAGVHATGQVAHLDVDDAQSALFSFSYDSFSDAVCACLFLPVRFFFCSYLYRP